MTRGWVVGSRDFAKALAKDNREWTGNGPRLAAELRDTQEARWADELAALLLRLQRRPGELADSGKSEGWKLALAAALQERTTAANRWLAAALHMGNLREVIRKVAAWRRPPDAGWLKVLDTPNPKA